MPIPESASLWLRYAKPLLATALIAALLVGTPAGTALLAAEPALKLNPKRPVIDVTGEIRKGRVERPKSARPAAKRKRVRKKKAPTVARRKLEALPRTVVRQPVSKRAVSASAGSERQTIEGVLRRELPPLDGGGLDTSSARPSTSTPSRTRAQDRGLSARASFKPLPQNAWRGVTMKRFAEISREYARRPRSRAIRKLWVRMFASPARPPAGAYNEASFEALRMQALYRLGAVDEIVRHAQTVPPEGRYAILNILEAKARIARGDEQAACDSAKSLISETGKVAETQQREFVEISVYCALRADDRSRAALMIELARDRGLDAPATFGVVDALTLGRTPSLPASRRLALIPGKLLVLGGYKPKRRFFSAATPALLLALANDPDIEPGVRLSAGERAADLGALSPSGLRRVYLESGRTAGKSGERAQAMKRFDSLSRQGAPAGRLLDQARRLLDLTRSGNLYKVVASALGPDVARLQQTPDAQSRAETAVEVTSAAGLQDVALGWAIFGSAYNQAGSGAVGRSLMHWQMPIDISDNRRGIPRGAGLVPTENLALRGRFSSDTLHRLVTALDSLGYVIPIPLWNKASNAPQPRKGYLPKTGVLGELRQAAEAGQQGHTLLLAIASLGPDGADKAHLIALGDSLRALRRVGLEDAAREIAFEMVYPVWPRQGRR